MYIRDFNSSNKLFFLSPRNVNHRKKNVAEKKKIMVCGPIYNGVLVSHQGTLSRSMWFLNRVSKNPLDSLDPSFFFLGVIFGGTEPLLVWRLLIQQKKEKNKGRC